MAKKSIAVKPTPMAEPTVTIRLTIDQLFIEMLRDTNRLLSEDELERVTSWAKECASDFNMARMALGFVGDCLCARNTELNSDEINEASAAVAYLTEQLEDLNAGETDAQNILIMHYKRVA